MSDSNERLNQLLIDQIEKFDGATDKAVDFVVEQTPDLIHQLLMWHGVKSGLYFAISIIALVVICVAYKKLWTYAEGYGRGDDDFIRMMGGVVAVLSFAGVLFGGVGGNMDWLQILIAPKLYLLEYAAGLVA